MPPLDSTGPNRSAPEGRSTTSLPAVTATRLAERADTRPAVRGADPALLRASFRELHGRHLHGFALLVTLGDRPSAARIAADALAEGTRRVDSLAHPERAAAWLRRRVLDGARGRRLAALHARSLPLGPDRLHALRQLGVESGPAEALASMDVLDRAALALANVERLGEADVADALGLGIPAARRRIRRARRRYAEAAVRLPAVRLPAVPRRGPLTELLRNVALDTMGSGGAEDR